MSIKAVAWALEQEIDDPISHLLLVNLADCTDSKSTCCWPGQEFLAKRIRRSTDTVQRHLKKLVKGGYITIDYRADEKGHRTSNLYTLNIDVTVGVTPKTSDVSQKPKPHPCGIGKDRLNRKSTPPKPQTGGCLNRTMDAVGTKGTVEPTIDDSARVDPHELWDKLLEAANGALYPLAVNLQVVSEPLGWLKAGADLEFDILPTVRAMASRCKPQSVRSWAYFAGAVSDAKERRLRGLPPPAPGSTANQPTTGKASKIERARAFQRRVDELMAQAKTEAAE